MTFVPVAEALQNLPNLPGVYLIQNKRRKIIYIGKAKSLKNRVKSHFQGDIGKSVYISAEATGIETIITTNESESLILENNLIKLYKPKYNVTWKDGKTYPFIEIDEKERYPRIRIVREKRKGKTYMGPFPNADALRQTVNYATRLFRVADCNLDITKFREKKKKGRIRCMKLRTKRCLAPCVSLVNTEEYGKRILNFKQFIAGNQETLIRDLQERMQEFAKNKEYERAAELRDQLLSIEKTLRKQVVANLQIRDCDIFGICRTESVVAVEVFFVRDGKLWGGDSCVFPLKGRESDKFEEEICEKIMKEFYAIRGHAPEKLVLDLDFRSAMDQTLKKLKEEKGWMDTYRKDFHYLDKVSEGSLDFFRNIEQIRKLRKQHKDLLRLANFNAQMEIQRVKENILDDEAMREVLERIQNLVQIQDIPHRIHGFDVSTLKGELTVASSVSFIWGKPFKKEYRRIRIKEKAARKDDFRAMREAITRRYRNYTPDSEDLPNLILVDGGAIQLQFAEKALKKLGLEIPIIGLAKKEEEIYLSEEEVVRFRFEDPMMRLLIHIRDESHRFARNYHINIRDKRMLMSTLDDVKGMGEKRKQVVLEAFGSVRNIAMSDLEQLKKVKGLPLGVAEELYYHLHPDEREGTSI